MKYEKNYITHSKIKELPLCDQPREKLVNLGSSALSDYELLTVLLSSGTNTIPVTEVAQSLLNLLDKKPNPELHEIRAIRGIGEAKATQIAASLELGRRRIEKKPAPITSPKDIFQQVKHYATREQEQFIVVVLNGAHEVMNVFAATVGLVNRTLVHPREVFSEPLKSRATAIAIAHNHPTGHLEPSPDDIDVTDRLVKCGNTLGIKILDHVIFSRDGYFSFLEHGLIE